MDNTQMKNMVSGFINTTLNDPAERQSLDELIAEKDKELLAELIKIAKSPDIDDRRTNIDTTSER